MDARKVMDFFKSRLGLMTLAAVGLGLLLLWVGDLRRKSNAGLSGDDVTRADSRPIGGPLETITRPDPGQLAPARELEPVIAPAPVPASEARAVSEGKDADSEDEIERPRERIALFEEPAGEISLATPAPEGPTVAVPTQRARPEVRAFSGRTAPYGRAIPCQLLFTVDSSRVETPVIGIVTQDVWWNGELIVPAGSEAHGTAQVDYEAGRIRAEGSWIIVLPGFSDVMNGAEIVVNAAALARDEGVNASGQASWGIDDGSFGMLGRTIRSENWDTLKLFIATFLGAAASTLESCDPPILSPFGGGAAQGPVQSTPTNAALAGLSAVVGEYAGQIQREIAENGFYTRVQSGTQFYLYVRQTIDLADARVGDSEVVRGVMEARRMRMDTIIEEAARHRAIASAAPGATILPNDVSAVIGAGGDATGSAIGPDQIEELGRLIEQITIEGVGLGGSAGVGGEQERF